MVKHHCHPLQLLSSAEISGKRVGINVLKLLLFETNSSQGKVSIGNLYYHIDFSGNNLTSNLDLKQVSVFMNI